MTFSVLPALLRRYCDSDAVYNCHSCLLTYTVNTCKSGLKTQTYLESINPCRLLPFSLRRIDRSLRPYGLLLTKLRERERSSAS